MHTVLIIPAKFAAEYAAGDVGLMKLAAGGLSTTLVSTSTGLTVSSASLVPAAE